MLDKCRQAAEVAIGRRLTKSEQMEIDSRLSDTIKQMARKDRQAILAMTPEERMVEAAQRASQQLVAEKLRDAQNKAANITARANIRAVIDADPAKGIDSLIDMVARNPGGAKVLSLESRANALKEMARADLIDAVMVAEPKFLGLFESKEGTMALHKELYGVDSGNAAAKNAARVFKERAEALRQRFNASGGNIGKLEDWTKPNHHSPDRIVAAGKDAWIRDMLTGDDGQPLVDMNRYVNDDGSLMTPQQMREFMESSYMNIVTDGASGRMKEAKSAISKGKQPTKVAGGSPANRNSAHRQIHFKSPEAELKYWQKYGERSLLDVMVGHFDSMANDIALIEQFGPNATNNFRQELSYALDAAKVANPENVKSLEVKAKWAQTLFDFQSGSNPGAQKTAFTNIMKGIRSLQIPILGSAYLTSMSDHGFSWLTANHNKMKYSRVIQKQIGLMRDPAFRDYARRQGLGLDSMFGGFSRLGEDGFSSGTSWHDNFAKYSQKFANATMRATFLQQATDIRRQAFAIEYLDMLGKMTRRGFDDYNPDDMSIYTRFGVNRDHWTMWNLAQVDDPRGVGDTILTPDAIYRLTDEQLSSVFPDDTPEQLQNRRDDAASMLLGMAMDESKIGILEPDLRTRAMSGAADGMNPLVAEVWRSFLQFKSFGIAQVFTHLKRAQSLPDNVGKAAYAAKMVGATTLMGALSIQLNALATGKDPQDMSTQKFWWASLLKGGSFGIYGDFLFGQTAKYGQGIAEVIMGPSASFMVTPFRVALEEAAYARDIAAGEIAKEPDSAAKMLRWARPLIPGSTLWYTKGAFDHLIFHDLQEMANPGYLRRMQGRIKKETGQKFWWEPGESVPDRLPDLGAVAGGSE